MKRCRANVIAFPLRLPPLELAVCFTKPCDLRSHCSFSPCSVPYQTRERETNTSVPSSLTENPRLQWRNPPMQLLIFFNYWRLLSHLELFRTVNTNLNETSMWCRVPCFVLFFYSFPQNWEHRLWSSEEKQVIEYMKRNERRTHKNLPKLLGIPPMP